MVAPAQACENVVRAHSSSYPLGGGAGRVRPLLTYVSVFVAVSCLMGHFEGVQALQSDPHDALSSNLDLVDRERVELSEARQLVLGADTPASFHRRLLKGCGNGCACPNQDSCSEQPGCACRKNCTTIASFNTIQNCGNCGASCINGASCVNRVCTSPPPPPSLPPPNPPANPPPAPPPPSFTSCTCPTPLGGDCGNEFDLLDMIGVSESGESIPTGFGVLV